MAATAALMTADEFEVMPDQDRYELIDGELVERPPAGYESDWIGGELQAILRYHLRTNRVGWVFGPDSGYRCFPDRPNRLRRPDVSFVRFGRFPNETIPKHYATFAPDLAVEVISPGDLAEEVETKIQQFLSAGVRLLWVVFPDSRVVHVRRPDGSARVLGVDDELSGEEVVPGFQCRVSDLFPPVITPA